MIEMQKAGSLAENPAQQLSRSPLRLSQNRFLTLAALVILFVIFSIFANNFFTVRSVLNLLVQTSTIVILSIGAMLVLAAGGIDFSLGAVVALGGTAVVVFSGLGVPIILGRLFGFLERVGVFHARPFIVPDNLGDLANNPVSPSTHRMRPGPAR